jgi:hypothetical protein
MEEVKELWKKEVVGKGDHGGRKVHVGMEEIGCI